VHMAGNGMLEDENASDDLLAQNCETMQQIYHFQRRPATRQRSAMSSDTSFCS
jgi:hypothetical protein